jgi:hypothetical protein
VTRIASTIVVAVVVGMFVGTLDCAAAESPGHRAGFQVDQHTTEDAIATVDERHQPHASPVEHGVTDTADDTADRHGADGANGHAHPGMTCLVDIDLRFADLDVSVIADDTPSVANWMPSEPTAQPEPPVPRDHS